MTVRNDITFYMNEDPRLIMADAPSSELTVQDLIDTCRDKEDDSAFIDEPHLIDAAGKEPLGGGVTVGITATLQNAKEAFEMPSSSISNGQATSEDLSGISLINTGATFISDGVVPGDTIINFTDLSVTTVLKVISENEIKHLLLTDGSNNTWSVDDVYKIWSTVQCDASGGNVTAVDSNGDEMNSIFPTAFTQIIKTSSSSATLQELRSIQHSSYNNGVTVDILSSHTGIIHPVGTNEAPVNNIPHAMQIANLRGLPKLYIKGNITLTIGNNVANMSIYGQDRIHTTITIEDGANVTNSLFYDCTLTGIFDGGNIIQDSIIGDIQYFDGIIQDCLLNPSTITLGNGADANIVHCKTAINGSPPIIDMGGSGQALGLIDYNGTIKITNKTGSDNVKIWMGAGEVILDTTITNGIITIGGNAELTNNTTGSTVVDSSALVSGVDISFIKDIEGGRWKIDQDNHQMIFYASNNSTEVARFNLLDKYGNPSWEFPIERVRV